MPVEWGILAAKTAASCALNLPASHAYREKVEPLFKKGDLGHELSRAYEAAFKAFVDVLRGPFDIDDVMDARLREMFADEGFQELLGRLAHERFEKLDTERARDLFLGLGLAGATATHFDFAWSTFGKRFRDYVAGTTHAAKLVEMAQNDRIEDYLARLVALTECRRTVPRDESATLAAYRRSMHRRYRLADTRGLFWREKETVGEEILLAEVFVETLVRRQGVGLRFPPKERPEGKMRGEAEPLDERCLSHLERERQEEPRAIADVLVSEKHLVILGPPGSGKTTLVRCLLLALTSEEDWRPLDPGVAESSVPILLSFKTYAARLRNDSSLKLDAFLRSEVGDDLPDLDEILTDGRALVLLDGLDEVFDEDHRRWVSDEVWRLMSRYGNARFVLTSRPPGYRAAPLPGFVPLFEMVPFDEDRIGRFFRGWFVALARQGLEVERGRPPERRADELTREVLARPRIRDVAENPMLSTLIVLVHRSRSGRLPERRVKFYEAAVSVLAEHWERVKLSPKQEGGLDFPEPETLIGALSDVAWRTQTELGGREIPAKLLKTWMLEALAQDPAWAGQQQRAVKDFLKVVRERVGLLVDAGGARYQFFHLSLQEYLAARYLLERLNERECCLIVRHFLHAPEWEEILRLTIGAAPRVRAEALVRAILNEPTSEWEDRIRRDLRFVCRCLEDRPNIGEEVRGDVERRWLEALQSPETLDKKPGLLACAEGLGRAAELRNRLDVDDGLDRTGVVDVLTQLGMDDDVTRTAIAARLVDNDERVRKSAIEYFVKIDADDEETRTAVAARLADDVGYVRSFAMTYFTKFEIDDGATRTAVAARLADDDGQVRKSAVDYFAKIGADDEETRAAIAARFADEFWVIRSSAVDYFAKIGADDEATRNSITALLADDNGNVRRSAVDYFAKIGADDEATRNSITALLADEILVCRLSAVDYLAEIGAGDEATRNAFVARLSDEDGRVRSSAVDYFTKVRADDETTRAAVAERLADDDGNARRSAVRYFASIGADDDATRTGIAARLSDAEFFVRTEAVDYFAKIGAEDEATRIAIAERLADDNFLVWPAAVKFFVQNGIQIQESSGILDLLTKNVLVLISDDIARKMNYQIGRLAATDAALLKRITGESIRKLDLAEALRAAAARRDELRREAVSCEVRYTRPVGRI